MTEQHRQPPRNGSPAASDDDRELTAAEVAEWIREDRALIDRFVRLRARYLAGDDDRRRGLAVEAGVRNLTDINETLKRCRTRLDRYERLLDSHGEHHDKRT